MKNRAFICLGVAVCALISTPAAAQETDLTKLSLADLLNVEVTSVSRKEQRLSRTAGIWRSIRIKSTGSCVKASTAATPVSTTTA